MSRTKRAKAGKMDVAAALKQLAMPSEVTFQSSPHLVAKVRARANKIDAARRDRQLPLHDRKPRLIAVSDAEHRGGMAITPWELLHVLGRATVLAGQGSSRLLAQHWSCLKYITSLQANDRGRMELSPDGKNPTYHRKAVQAEDLGIAFALAAALRIACRRHPDHHFQTVDAEVALEAGWALKGAEVKSRDNVKLRPDYFLVGVKSGEPVRIITVECKGSHGRVEAQHEQLAKAAAQVHAVVIGDAEKDGGPPPSLLAAAALAARGGIEVRILDPEGEGVLELPGHRMPALNGPVQELSEYPDIPRRLPDGRIGSRPGFHIPPRNSEWFSRVLARTAASSLLAFAGDRAAARSLLTPRQQGRVGALHEHPSTGITQDTEITLGGLHFVGTDHVFRFGSHRFEAFSGIHGGLHRLLAERSDIQGYESALPAACHAWRTRMDEVQQDWGGVIAMDADGAVLALREMGTGREDLR